MTPTEVQKSTIEALRADGTLAAAKCGVSAMDDGNFQAALEKAMGLGGSGLHAVVSAPTFAPESSVAVSMCAMKPTAGAPSQLAGSSA